MPERTLQADVAVIGAGPAGLAAAAAAREAGRSVLVIDENPAVGGQIWREARGRGARPETRRLLERALGATFLAGAAVFDGRREAGRSPASELSCWHRVDGVKRVRAASLVLATGASERFLPFPGWTSPGVLGVGGLQALVKGGFDVAGRRVLVAGSGPLLLAVAAALVDAGARVVAVLEQAPRARVLRFGLGLASTPRKLVEAAALLRSLRGVPQLHGAWLTDVKQAAHTLCARAACGASEREFDVDLVAVGFGLTPALGLGLHLGCARAGDALAVDARQRTSVAGVLAAGETTGIGGVDAALAEGTLAGLVASDVERRDTAGARAVARAAKRVARARRFSARLERAFALRAELRGLVTDDTLVCRCEDVPWGALKGLGDAREAKLATRCGMGACQARVCGAALEFLQGWPRETPRPPLVPVPFAALASGPGPEHGGA